MPRGAWYFASERRYPRFIPMRRKAWTILVFMAGDNDLDEAGVADLLEMKKVGSTSDINVVVQFDRAKGEGRTHRLYLTRSRDIRKDVVETLRETNTGAPTTLESFTAWGVVRYPARRYMLVIWNHGAGWSDEDVYRLAGTPSRAVRAGIAYDDSARDFLSNSELRSALDSAARVTGRPLDVVAFDACLMNMIEVVYQLRHVGGVIIGSQEVEPDTGWPYDDVLLALAERPGTETDDVAKMIVARFASAYRSSDVTQSALRARAAESVRRAVDWLCEEVMERWSDVADAVSYARGEVQSYTVSDYVDLIDFCKLLRAQPVGRPIQRAATAVITASKRMIIASRTSGTRLRFSTGVSIYFPHRPPSRLYYQLDFARDSRWPELLALYAGRSVEL